MAQMRKPCGKHPHWFGWLSHKSTGQWHNLYVLIAQVVEIRPRLQRCSGSTHVAGMFALLLFIPKLSFQWSSSTFPIPFAQNLNSLCTWHVADDRVRVLTWCHCWELWCVRSWQECLPYFCLYQSSVSSGPPSTFPFPFAQNLNSLCTWHVADDRVSHGTHLMPLLRTLMCPFGRML